MGVKVLDRGVTTVIILVEMSPVKPQEVLAHATQLWRRQPPTRSVAQIQVPYYPRGLGKPPG